MIVAQTANPFDPPLSKKNVSYVRWSNLRGSALSLAICNAALKHKSKVLVIAPEVGTVHQRNKEIDFFLKHTNNVADNKTISQLPIERLEFPDWETLPYDTFSPHPGITSQRLSTLSSLLTPSSNIIVASVATLMCKLAPKDYIGTRSLHLCTGDQIDLTSFRANLVNAGYRTVGQVMEPGEFAVRGSLIDLFPMGAQHPIRIDLFDNELESIRYFSTESQRSVGKIDSIKLLPAREIPSNEDAISKFRQNWRKRFDVDANNCSVYTEVSQGFAPAGIEYYLPLFFDQTATLFDFIPQNTLIIELEHVHDAAEKHWEIFRQRNNDLDIDITRPLLSPGELNITTSELYATLKSFQRIKVTQSQDILVDNAQDPSPASGRIEQSTNGNAAISFATHVTPRLPVNARAEEPFKHLENFIADFSGRILILADSPGRRETLLETFSRHSIQPEQVETWHHFLESQIKLAISVGELDEGLIIDEPNLAIICESQLFGERAAFRKSRQRKGKDAETIIRNLAELDYDCPVVHEWHGIGRYRNLVKLNAGGLENEYLCLEYADSDKLYVPVTSLHLISRYSGLDSEHAPLHRLGSGQWEKARKKATEDAFDVAAELLEIQAIRAAREGVIFDLDNDALSQFENEFAFEETPDQQKAIDEILDDMKSPKPMDRLVCGDVGFGKTEVAMRAAFVAVQNGYQVALLAPTTLLAQQHLQTFNDRFANWPVNIAQLSRFKSAKESREILADAESGKLDIVIGTHKLLQNDLKFKRLGLMIIDEEHRFGVRQKEKLKSLRALCDVLTLTATPIPRTLNMSLSGMRDLSLIATPPTQRLAVKTFVTEWNDGLIREAILRELNRGGQIFFVHNRVLTIEKTAAKVSQLVPEGIARVAHGQMRESELERVMLEFYRQHFNILVCTTIIETGLDIPSANTIIMDRADRLGLAQLHQLRGRVGRSHHRAYAYLVAPPRRSLAKDAIKRLDALAALDELGTGFTLATHDMEIRGAGELLGKDQSGKFNEVGYAMYARILERAVRAIKQGKMLAQDIALPNTTEVDIGTPTLIPEIYLPDVHERLVLYKRIASTTHKSQLDLLLEEMVDRFGKLPYQVKMLFKTTYLRLLAEPFGIRKINLSTKGGKIVFAKDVNIDPKCIVELIQTNPQRYKIEGGDMVRISGEFPEPENRAQELVFILKRLRKLPEQTQDIS